MSWARSSPLTRTSQTAGTAPGSVIPARAASAWVRLAAILAVQAVAIPLQDRLPVLVRKFLMLGLGLLGGELIGLDPVVAVLLVPQLLPGRLAPGIEPHHGVIVGEGLFLESHLIAPLGEFPLGIGFIRRGCPALEVLLQHRPSLRDRS